MKVEEESEKVGFKLHIQKPKIIAFDPITSWEIDGGKMNTVTDLFSWAPKSLRTETAVTKLKDVCSWEENYTKPRQCIKKQRHHFADKGPYTQSMVFPVVMYGCESWTIKKAEHWRTDAFELWCWRRHMRTPWTPRRANQSILKEINSEYSLEGLILEPQLQYIGLLMWKTNSLEKTLMLGNIEGRRRRGRQRMKWLDENIQPSLSQWTWVWANSGR